MGCEEYSSIGPDGYSFGSEEENASVLDPDHVMDSFGVHRVGEMKRNSLSSVISETGNTEAMVISYSACTSPDVFKLEPCGPCSENKNSAGQDITSANPSKVSQVVSGPEHMAEAHVRCIRTIKQMEDGDSFSSLTERCTEGSDDDGALRSKAVDNQEQELFLKEPELTDKVIPDTVVQVDCNKQEDGKDCQDVIYSVVPIVSESLQEKGGSHTKEYKDSGGTALPIGGSETDAKLAFVSDAPEQCEALEVIKDRADLEIGGGIISCTSDGGVKEETTELLNDQDPAPSDDASCFRSCQLLSDSILDTGGLSFIPTKDGLKTSSETGGNMDIPSSPSLVLAQIFCSQTKEDDSNVGDLCATDLENVEYTKTMTTNIPEKSEQKPENHAWELSTEDIPDAFKDNTDITACITAKNFSQVSPVEENAQGLESSFPMTMSSLKLNLPSESGQGIIDVPDSNNTVQCLETMDVNGRIGGEIASASEINCSETIMLHSRRKGRDSKQSKKAQKKKGSPRPRKSCRKKQSEKSSELIFKCSKQKRSCFSKPARSSEWGLPSSTTQIFMQSNNLPFIEPPIQGSQKSQSNRGNSESSKSCYNGHSKESNGKIQTSSSCCLRLKVKFGKSDGLNPLNVTVSKVIDTSLSANDNGNVGAGLEIPLSANFVEDKLQTAKIGKQLEYTIPVKEILDKEPVDSLVGAKLERDDLEARDLCGKLAGDAADDDHSLNILVKECGKTSENHYMDAETSPDSEVINSVPDAFISAGRQGDLHHSVLGMSEVCAIPPDAISRKENKKKGLKKDKSLSVFRSLVEDGSPLIGSPIKSKQLISQESLDQGSCKDAHPSFDLQLGGSHSSKRVIGVAKSKGKAKSKGVPKTPKSNGTKKGKVKISESFESRRIIESGEQEEQQKPITRNIGKEESGGNEVGCVESHEMTDNLKTSAVKGTGVTNGEMVLGGTIEESASADSAWVRCDDCFKWRRIPASLVGTIDENCRWICMNNLEKDFADCSIPQEMSNEEINAELGITQDEAVTYDGDVANKEKGKGQKCKRLPGNQKACFKAVRTNQFLHRNRKAQTIDEIMVCHCKPPPDGRFGCGEECLNRMLNIECVQGTCPCGDFCSNQQFQKRKYAKFERFQSGKKGNGLRLLEDVRKGQFLIEYVGEVLDMQAYEARQKDYAAKGQKHFYFMTLNGNEVIDAGSKGNLGRFINHSCEPNCRTEKWMVNGEICVGIFSLQDINKGEEVTFDYNYVRVFGAAAKKCYCGSLHCRGYIGGDPLNGDVVVQSDSDEESAEPVILEDDESGDGILNATSRISIDGAEVKVPQNLAKIDGSKDHASEVSERQSSISVEPLEREVLPPLQPTEISEEHTVGMSVGAVQQEVSVEGEIINLSSTSVSVSKLSSDSTEADKKAKHGLSEDKKMVPRSRPLLKTSRTSGSSKRDKASIRPSVTKAHIIPANKLQQQPVKSKGSEEVSPSGRIETFEGKLNELLDTEGGISKRKDSTKGYLKLLLLTAASRGNANNEGIQSNRDLSMILDALLKTKSRAVLLDVINKNGLQMLHNIMKQYRRDFKKTPILRKLLKVLEYLAKREILTLEHIIRRPPCLGMESFKDSILTLTEHDDKQVHQIARNFRDRWIPKPFRRPYYVDRDERMESTRELNNSRFLGSQAPQYDHHSTRPTEPISLVSSSRAASSETASASEGGSEPISSVPEANRIRIRKRKSRWDQPAMTKEQRTEPGLHQQTSETTGHQDMQDDLPPGFSSPRKQLCHNNAPDAVVAQPQGKFMSRMPVSYGIPLSIVHEFSLPNKEDPDSWSVAPGIPFQPFPPLPPVSRDEFFSKKNGSVSTSDNDHGNPTCSGESLSGAPVFNQACWNIPGTETNSGNIRKRGFSSDIGRRYFRQQKWNVPPWIRNDWGNQRNGGGNTNGPKPGNITFDNFNNSYC